MKPQEKILLHCDMNNYFASVECLYNPLLREVPMAVCGDPSMRHGIVLAKNDLAKQLGIVTGESIYTAKQKAPNLTIVTADYEKYIKYTNLSRALFSLFSEQVIPYGLDEAWLDVTNRMQNFEQATTLAEELKETVKAELGLTCSVGVSYNYIFSKLASDMKKPDKVTVLMPSQLKTVIWNLPAFEMLFVGPATRRKLKMLGILTIGDLANADERILKSHLGKNGVTLKQYANGDDGSFDPQIPQDILFKSAGNSITLPKDLLDVNDMLTMLLVLSGTVSARLRKHGLKADCLCLHLRYSDFSQLNRRKTLEAPTNQYTTVFSIAKQLFEGYYNGSSPIRSIGLSVSGLSKNADEQLYLWEETDEDREMSEMIEGLKARLGEFQVNKSPMSGELLSEIHLFEE